MHTPTTPLRHVQVTYPEPHLERMRVILGQHPEIKRLFGPTPSTFWYVAGLVVLQTVLAATMPHLPWWLIAVTAYVVGATANHALWVLIHECTHNLVFKRPWANACLQIFANLPFTCPSAMSFRTYHLKHHLFQGDYDRDADLPRPFEARWVGNSTWRKTLWFTFFFASQLIRVPFLKGIEVINRWVVANWVVELAFLAAVGTAWGPKALVYLVISSVFSIGLHPLGARWIQEHYVVHQQQETYSYYGPLNRIAFNVGFHNEHHDFMNVAWSRLPAVRAAASEHYDTLYWHRSWPGLLWRFLTDPELSLYSRVIRERAPTAARMRSAMPAGSPTSAVSPGLSAGAASPDTASAATRA